MTREKAPNPVAILCKLFDETDRELFRDRRGEAFATVTVGEHRETVKVKSRRFRSFLRHLYAAAKVGPAALVSKNIIEEAVEQIVSTAEMGRDVQDVHVRIAHHDEKIYLDLGDETWRAVEIDADGWELVEDPPVKFQRTASMLPLPAPKARGGEIPDWQHLRNPAWSKPEGKTSTINILRRFVNVRDEHWPLVVAFLVGAFCGGPYPVLQLYAEAGSAKTSALRFLRLLVDPADPIHRTTPKDERDMAIAATNGLIFAVDNVSRIEQWLSDTFCRLSTGGGFGTRKHYTDDEEQLFKVRRPAIITSINEVATSGDLLSRSLVVPLPRIEKYKSEKLLNDYFELKRSEILGALLDGVVYALANPLEPGSVNVPRLADFAGFAIAAAPALGIERSEMLEAFQRNVDVATETTLEASPLVEPLFKLMNGPKAKVTPTGRLWAGTMRELLDEISPAGYLPEQRARAGWPTAPQGLSGKLRRIAPALRERGLVIDFPDEDKRKGKDRDRVVTLVYESRAASPDGAA